MEWGAWLPAYQQPCCVSSLAHRHQEKLRGIDLLLTEKKGHRWEKTQLRPQRNNLISIISRGTKPPAMHSALSRRPSVSGRWPSPSLPSQSAPRANSSASNSASPACRSSLNRIRRVYSLVWGGGIVGGGGCWSYEHD